MKEWRQAPKPTKAIGANALLVAAQIIMFDAQALGDSIQYTFEALDQLTYDTAPIVDLLKQLQENIEDGLARLEAG